MVTIQVCKILFVELLGGIGDVLIALPAIQALARSYPASELTVLTLPPGGELLESEPQITRVVYADSGNPRKSVELLLARHTFDVIVSDTNYNGIEQVIQNSGASRVVTNLWRTPPADQRVGDRFLQILLAEGLSEVDTGATPTSSVPVLPEAGTQALPLLHLTPAEVSRAQAALSFCPSPSYFYVQMLGCRLSVGAQRTLSH